MGWNIRRTVAEPARKRSNRCLLNEQALAQARICSHDEHVVSVNWQRLEHRHRSRRTLFLRHLPVSVFQYAACTEKTLVESLPT
ncbi:Hypothetical protein HDN1F_33200 [gamma proteobacterium HdN1]|nr:Hypothetical protein HDN1F_33200 [gamma proteobacterium HdN1]